MSYFVTSHDEGGNVLAEVESFEAALAWCADDVRTLIDECHGPDDEPTVVWVLKMNERTPGVVQVFADNALFGSPAIARYTVTLWPKP